MTYDEPLRMPSTVLPPDSYYCRGFGWGVSIRGGGDIRFLIRAVEVADESGGALELGMTEFASLLALHVGVTLGPGRWVDFHVSATSHHSPLTALGGRHSRL